MLLKIQSDRIHLRREGDFMNIYIPLLVAAAEFLLIDTVSFLRIFRDLANQGFKIDYERLEEFCQSYDSRESSCDRLLRILIPSYSFCQTYCDIKMYNESYREFIQVLYTLGLITKMNDFELREYQKNASIINAIIVPMYCEVRLDNAYCLELNDNQYLSKIWFELKKIEGKSKIEILLATGPIANQSEEEQQQAIESFLVTYALEKGITLENSDQNMSLATQKEILEAYRETLEKNKEDQPTLKRKRH